MNRELARFKSSGGANLLVKVLAQVWLIIQSLANLSQSSNFRVISLRCFGASIGSNVKIRSRTRVHFPWNLTVGNNSWIGEEVWIINHEKVIIGSDVCISQKSVICSSGHDYRTSTFDYAHAQIEIKDGAWICLDAKVLPGVSIGKCSVVAAGEIVRKSLPDHSMLIDRQVRKIELPK